MPSDEERRVLTDETKQFKEFKQALDFWHENGGGMVAMQHAVHGIRWIVRPFDMGLEDPEANAPFGPMATLSALVVGGLNQDEIKLEMRYFERPNEGKRKPK